MLSVIGSGIKNIVGGLPFGIGYATGTKIGFEGVGELLFPSRKSYNYRQPTNFRLPYYRFRRYSRYSRRYGRFRRRRPRFFRRYRTRRFY